MEQQISHGSWAPCAFYCKKLEGKTRYGPNGEPLGLTGPRAWSVREKEIYALVSCLLKFICWISGRKFTVFTDQKSRESLYKEDLCTMAGQMGRCRRWHEFLCRYNIVVVYKLGKDNDVPEGLSQWAYLAGSANDTNFHGADADLKGYEDWEAQEKAVNDALLDRLCINRD